MLSGTAQLRIDADVADLTGFAQPEKLFRNHRGCR
jgi:hypothetical protein